MRDNASASASSCNVRDASMIISGLCKRVVCQRQVKRTSSRAGVPRKLSWSRGRLSEQDCIFCSAPTTDDAALGRSGLTVVSNCTVVVPYCTLLNSAVLRVAACANYAATTRDRQRKVDTKNKGDDDSWHGPERRHR